MKLLGIIISVCLLIFCATIIQENNSSQEAEDIAKIGAVTGELIGLSADEESAMEKRQ